MTKEIRSSKEAKKKALLTPKQKRAVKVAKKQSKHFMPED